MKLDHFVVNINQDYQNKESLIQSIRAAGFPYEPKFGKGTGGFKASNIWIGQEYLEMVAMHRPDGGGWVPEWVTRYNAGERGMICLMLDVEDIDGIYERLNHCGVTKPKWLEFKYFFQLLTRRMPWRNAYAPFFEGAPFQIGFQQMKDEKSRAFMDQYMVPNASDNGISGISAVHIGGNFSENDFDLLQQIFENRCQRQEEEIRVQLANQTLLFKQAPIYETAVYTTGSKNQAVSIENMQLFC